MVKRLTTIATVAAALVTAAGAPAMAQGTRRPARPAQTPAPAAAPTPPPDATTVEARTAYDEGRREFDAGHFEQAITAFQRAFELRSNPVVLLPIAESQERLNRIPDAVATLERYLQLRADAPDRAQIEQRIAALRARPATLHVTSTPPGAQVFLDDRDTGMVTPADVPAPAGHHVVRLQLAGYAAATSEVDVTAGARQDVAPAMTAEAAPATPATPPPGPAAADANALTGAADAGAADQTARRGTSPVVWVAGGVAAASLIAGSVFGFVALGDRAEYDRNPTVATRDSGEAHALLADMFFGAAVLSAGVALVVYLSDRGAPPAAAAPASGPGTTGATSSLRRAPAGPRVRPTLGGLVINF